jgi:flagellar hook assembly protein FlgD
VTIHFEAAVGGVVRASIHGPAGRLIRRLVDGDTRAGMHDLFWDGRNDEGRSVAAGNYWVRVSTAEGSASKQLLVLR